MVKKLKADGIHCHQQQNQEQYRVDYTKRNGIRRPIRKGIFFVLCRSPKPEVAYLKIMSELNATRDEVMLWDDIDRFVEAPDNLE